MSISNLGLSSYTDQLSPCFKDVQIVEGGYKRSITTSIFKPATAPVASLTLPAQILGSLVSIPVDGKSNLYRLRGTLSLTVAVTGGATLYFYLAPTSEMGWTTSFCPQGTIIAETTAGSKLYSLDILCTPPPAWGTTELFLNVYNSTANTLTMTNIAWAAPAAGPGAQMARLEGTTVRMLN